MRERGREGARERAREGGRPRVLLLSPATGKYFFNFLFLEAQGSDVTACDW